MSKLSLQILVKESSALVSQMERTKKDKKRFLWLCVSDERFFEMLSEAMFTKRD